MLGVVLLLHKGLKMIAIQIANSGHFLFTTMYYEEYTRPINDELKSRLREDELEVLGYLSDTLKDYIDEQSIDNAFKKNIDIQL